MPFRFVISILNNFLGDLISILRRYLRVNIGPYNVKSYLRKNAQNYDNEQFIGRTRNCHSLRTL